MEGRKNTIEFVKPALAQESQAQATDETKQEATPVCENGVCSISWKPQRPQAA